MDEEFLKRLAGIAEKSNVIDERLYNKYNVKRGLRNKNHTGVLVGLTNIGDVVGYDFVDGRAVPIGGRLVYRGIEIEDLVKGFRSESRQGFDETVFLLLFGKLPTKDELGAFSLHMSELRALPHNFAEDMLLKLKGRDVMNMLARSVLALYPLDKNADDTSVINVLKQSMYLIAKFPAIIIYSYFAMRYHYYFEPLVIRPPKEGLSSAENFLYMLKGNAYTPLEASILDLVLVLHAEHGGGNNSSFATHVVSSSGTDTYSAIAAALGSLKGPLHGGANIKVIEMMDDIRRNVRNWKDDNELREYLMKIFRKEAFDRSGRIYGFGHAVYTLSDPRAVLLREEARRLAEEKGRVGEFELYLLVESLAPKLFAEFKGTHKILCTNVDFYSGFVYECLGIPKELNTPLFAMARIAGWCAHRMEELVSSRKIIRPAYRNVWGKSEYVPLSERKQA